MKFHSHLIMHPSGKLARMNTIYDETTKTAMGILFPLKRIDIVGV